MDSGQDQCSHLVADEPFVGPALGSGRSPRFVLIFRSHPALHLALESAQPRLDGLPRLGGLSRLFYQSSLGGLLFYDSRATFICTLIVAFVFNIVVVICRLPKRAFGLGSLF